MTNRRRNTIATAAAGLATGLLLSACSSSVTPAAHAPTAPVAKTGSAATASPATSTNTERPVIRTSAAAASAVTSACALVTEKEVSTTLGADPGPGTPFSSHGASQCQYGTYQTAFVLVNLNPSRGQAAYDHMRHDPKIGRAGTVADISGLGDRAFGISGHNAASIYINKGDALVLVMVDIRTATSAPKDQARALATNAADRL